MNDVTMILNAAAKGDDHSAEALLPLVYEELRSLARSQMAMESASHTLQPTALVHEAWLRMVKDSDRTWQNRAYFFVAAAQSMRRILVEHARRKSRLKRGGDQVRLNLDDLELSDSAQQADVILLVDDALEQLERLYPQRAQVVTLKYYGGMTNREVSETMGISEAKVERHWTFSRVWLHDRISTSL